MRQGMSRQTVEVMMALRGKMLSHSVSGATCHFCRKLRESLPHSTGGSGHRVPGHTNERSQHISVSGGQMARDTAPSARPLGLDWVRF